MFLLTPAMILGGTAAVGERSFRAGLVVVLAGAVTLALYLGLGGLITMTGMSLERLIRRR
jgi:hypothetical protein